MKKKPNLITLSHGGGVQTGTLAEMIAEGFIERPDAVIFSDTGDEPAYILPQVEYNRKRLAAVGVPLIIVNNGSLHDDLYGGKRFAAMPLFTVLRDGVSKKHKPLKVNSGSLTLFDIDEYVEALPDTVSGFGVEAQNERRSKMKRQCTNEYKIVPIERELRTMLLEMRLAKETKNGAIRVNKDALVETWIGYTLDEAERVKPSRHKWQRFRYPLIDMRMTKADCIKWLEDRGLPIPLSSHCRKCPLIGDKRQLEMREHDPKGWENRLQFDRDLRNGSVRLAASAKGDLFVHPSCVPLDEVELNEKEYPLLGCVNHCMT